MGSGGNSRGRVSPAAGEASLPEKPGGLSWLKDTVMLIKQSRKRETQNIFALSCTYSVEYIFVDLSTKEIVSLSYTQPPLNNFQIVKSVNKDDKC